MSYGCFYLRLFAYATFINPDWPLFRRSGQRSQLYPCPTESSTREGHANSSSRCVFMFGRWVIASSVCVSFFVRRQEKNALLSQHEQTATKAGYFYLQMRNYPHCSRAVKQELMVEWPAVSLDYVQATHIHAHTLTAVISPLSIGMEIFWCWTIGSRSIARVIWFVQLLRLQRLLFYLSFFFLSMLKFQRWVSESEDVSHNEEQCWWVTACAFDF